MKKRLLVSFSILSLIFLVSLSIAHVEEQNFNVDAHERYPISPGTAVIYGSLIFTFLILIILTFHKKMGNEAKKIVFSSVVILAVLVTIYLIATTLHLNITSETKGPVHWHADFEIWNCGQNLDLVNPTGFTNKVGTPVLHEHDDFRVHVEGVLVDKIDASLGAFFHVIGGSLASDSFEMPTTQGTITSHNGESCNGQQGYVQAFLLKVQNPTAAKNTGFIYSQEKLNNYVDYVLSPYTNVPPGDCIIIEFSEQKERTDKICATFAESIRKGALTEVK